MISSEIDKRLLQRSRFPLIWIFRIDSWFPKPQNWGIDSFWNRLPALQFCTITRLLACHSENVSLNYLKDWISSVCSSRCVMLKSWRKVSSNIRSKSSSWWSLCSSSTFMMISFLRLKWLVFSTFSSLMVSQCWYLDFYNAFRWYKMQFSIHK